MTKKNTFYAFAIVCSFIFLFLSFKYNTWNASQNEFFETFQGDTSSEAFVLHRLKLSQSHGVFSGHGLMKVRWTDETYFSQLGSQALALGLVQKLTGWTHFFRLQTLVALLNAGLLVTLVFFFAKLSSFGSSILTIIILGLSTWLVAVGRNLYWVYGLMWLPTLAVWLYSYLEHRNPLLRKNWILFTLVAATIFLKCSAGYEFLSSVMWGMLVPPFYDFVSKQRNLKLTLHRFILIGCAGTVGFVCTLILHFAVVSDFLGSSKLAFETIRQKIAARTYQAGILDQVPEAVSVTNDILFKYVRIIAIDVKNFLPIGRFFDFSFGNLLYIAIIFTSLIFVDGKYFPTVEKNRSRLFALFSASWFAFLGPLSWFFLARGHVYRHEHLDSIVWYIVFIPLMTTASSFIFCSIMVDLKNLIHNKLNIFEYKN